MHCRRYLIVSWVEGSGLIGSHNPQSLTSPAYAAVRKFRERDVLVRCSAEFQQIILNAIKLYIR